MNKRMRSCMIAMLMVFFGSLAAMPQAQGLLGGTADASTKTQQPQDHFEKPARALETPEGALAVAADTTAPTACSESLKPEAKAMAASLDRIAGIMMFQTLLTVGSIVVAIIVGVN